VPYILERGRQTHSIVGESVMGGERQRKKEFCVLPAMMPCVRSENRAGPCLVLFLLIV